MPIPDLVAPDRHNEQAADVCDRRCRPTATRCNRCRRTSPQRSQRDSSSRHHDDAEAQRDEMWGKSLERREQEERRWPDLQLRVDGIEVERRRRPHREVMPVDERSSTHLERQPVVENPHRCVERGKEPHEPPAEQQEVTEPESGRCDSARPRKSARKDCDYPDWNLSAPVLS